LQGRVAPLSMVFVSTGGDMNTSQVLHASLFICRNENKALGIHCRVRSVAASGAEKQSPSAYSYQCTSRFSIPAI